jgi:hypothetical protein
VVYLLGGNAQQIGHQTAQVAVVEAVDQMLEQRERQKQRHETPSPEKIER